VLQQLVDQPSGVVHLLEVVKQQQQGTLASQALHEGIVKR
jgi:hypothetical protein